jgi:hypothetical protein
MVSEERHGDLDGDTVAEVRIETEGTSAAARDDHPEITMEQMHSLRAAFNRMLQLVLHEQKALDAISTIGTRVQQHALRRWRQRVQQQQEHQQNMAKAQQRIESLARRPRLTTAATPSTVRAPSETHGSTTKTHGSGPSDATTSGEMVRWTRCGKQWTASLSGSTSSRARSPKSRWTRSFEWRRLQGLGRWCV